MWNVRCMCVAVLALAVATVPAQAQGFQVGNDGWTVATASPDTRKIYVSSSIGNDNNSGLSAADPKKTLAAGFALLRNGHPDWLLLKSGDTWYESFPFWNRAGRSQSERMIVRSYGSGPRPRILTGSETAVYLNPGTSVQGVRYLAFMDLHLRAHTNSGTASATGFLFFNGVHHALIENCHVENYRVNMIFQAFADNIRASNIAVRRSIIVDAIATSSHAQGIYADGVDGLVMEENVFDLNGWSPSGHTANIYRHNIYIQTQTGGDRGCTDVVTRGNITARASATGFMMRTGGISEDNLYLQNPINLQFGQRSGPASGGIIRNNVVLDSRDISPTLERGIGINVSFADGVEVIGNIIAHQRTGTENVQALGFDGSYRNVTVTNNIVYDWRRPGRTDGRALGWFDTPLNNIVVRNNQFEQPGGGYMVGHWASLGPAFTYTGNRYHSSNNGTNQFFTGKTYSAWVSLSGETGSTWASNGYPSPERDIAAYMTSMSRPASLEAFMQEARKQARHNWRPEFTAGHVNQWVRAGFGVQTGSCYANCNGATTEPLLSIDDFTCFINEFAAASALPHEQQVEHYANCDGSTSQPALTVDDLTCFINQFIAGCP